MKNFLRRVVTMTLIPWLKLGQIIGLVDRTQVMVLCYHSISDDATDPYAISPMQFERQLEIINRHVRVVTLDQALAYAQDRIKLEGLNVALTFDDGYQDFITQALPRLKHYALPSMLFISQSPEPHLLGNQHMLLSRDDLQMLVGESLVALGAHGVTHHKFTDLEQTELQAELQDSKKFVEDLSGHPCVHLSYPRSAVNERVKAATRTAGYQAGWSISQGTIKHGSDVFHLKRVVVKQNISLLEFRWRLTRIIDWIDLIQRKYLTYVQ